MKSTEYIRVSACSPLVSLADADANLSNISRLVEAARSCGSNVALFPELSLTGYTCADLFRNTLLLESAENALMRVAELTAGNNMFVVVGAPLAFGDGLYNCAVACSGGEILGAVPKSYIPNYNEFYEKRWFSSGFGIIGETIRIGDRSYPFGTDLLFDIDGVLTAIEICEDLWVPVAPSSKAALAGATMILNLSATDELIGKHDYLLNLIQSHSAKCRMAYIYASAGSGESSTDLVFAGNAIVAEDGVILKESERFSKEAVIVTADVDIQKIISDRRVFNSFSDNKKIFGADSYRIVETGLRLERDEDDRLLRHVGRLPFVPSDNDSLTSHCTEIVSIQSAALMQRLSATKCRNVVVGISGGLDSTLALLVAVRAFDSLGLDRKGIYGITMPGFGTTGRTHSNATEIMERLGVTALEIPISEAVSQHFSDIDHDPEVHDAVYENSQARERTQILMDYANKVGGMVIGTGDLSELALGWCTYNGDHMSMYAVNSSVPKTLVRHLVKWFADVEKDLKLKTALLDIIDTPISPELIPADENGNIAQKTEDLVGPYELHDFFLFHTLRNGFTPSKIYRLARTAFSGTYDEQTIKHWLKTFYRRFFSQQFKRSCMPDGPKIGSVCLSPRGDWRMPSDANASLWLREIDSL